MKPEMMHVITRGNVLDLRKAGIFQPAREHDVTCDAISPQTHRRETHAHLKCDARFFGQPAYRPTPLPLHCEPAISRGGERTFPGKMLAQGIPRAGMRLVAVREGPS